MRKLKKNKFFKVNKTWEKTCKKIRDKLQKLLKT